MNPQRRAEFLLFLTTFIWGSTFVISKASLENASPFLWVALRFGGATILLTALFPKKLKGLTRKSYGRGATLAIFLYIGFMLQQIGLEYTTASKSAFFTGMLVVSTPIVQLIWEKRAPSIGNLVGIVFAATGLFLLTSPAGASFNLGDGLTLIGAGLFGVYIVYLDIVSADTDRYHLVYGQISATAAYALTGLLLFETPHINWTTGIISSFLYLTLFATLISTWVQTRFQGDTIPTRAAVIFTLEPVIAAVLAYVIRDERLGLIGIIGGVVIVSGLLISELSGESEFLNRPITGRN